MIVGLIGLFTVTFGMDKVFAVVSGPVVSPSPSSIVSAPVVPSPSASSNPISSPVSPSPVVSPSASPSPTPSSTWKGEYYNNSKLAGYPTWLTFTPDVNFNWGHSSPIWWINKNNFSAKWTTKRYFEGGRYRVTTSNDDGLRFYVDGKLIHSSWYNQPAISRSFDMDFSKGNHTLKVEYYEKGGLASAKISFQKI